MSTLTEETVEINQETTQDETPSILRTAENGCWEVYDGTWGSYLRPAFDPDANAVITDDHLKHFELNENIHRIPADLWAKWVKLCFHYVDKVQECVEVSVRILRSEADPSVYRLLVPRQKVSGGSVRVDSFDEAIDLATGEEITQYPPEGWIPVGSSHSHNTMQAFFSGTDDKYELGDPGIHIVVGSINTKDMKYTIAASVVGSGRRFSVVYDKLIDATPVPGEEFHPKVIDYVDYSTPVVTYATKGGFTQYPSNWTKKETKSVKTNWNNFQNWGWEDTDYNDPFYWSNSYSSSNKSSNVWNIMDSAKDFVNENRNDFNALKELRDELYDFLSDLEILMEDDAVVM
jgi:hypothetical protein